MLEVIPRPKHRRTATVRFSQPNANAVLGKYLYTSKLGDDSELEEN